ncbi:MAG TPA: glycine hydroxymethyltransferase [bacterium]|nr:glycine hydroxymethyltransferase [bacterium]
MNPRTRLVRYLDSLGGTPPDSGAAAYYASLDMVESVSPGIARSIANELRDQRSNVKLIASENYSSLAVQLAAGNLLTDKYAEGYPGHRFYAGCDNIDTIESEACELAQSLFGADHAYVQPHSGADANLTALLSILYDRVRGPFFESLGAKKPEEISRADWQRLSADMTRQKLLGLDYYSGGHLTHGYRFNAISHLFNVYSYTVDPETFLLDYDEIRRQALEIRPLVLLAGYSAYSRAIDFSRFREIADEIGAVLWVDMAHFAGLVAGGVFAGVHDPVAYADIVTTTTHKTLRGPRGGMVLCRAPFAEAVDKGCPTILGGPIPQAMAAKAVALREASRPEFRDYAHRIVENARSLAEESMRLGLPVLTGGTDNHLLLIDVASSFGLTGRHAESALRSCGITLNRNAIPFDKNGPWFTSGLRLGTPAVTTLGMGAAEMREIAEVVHDVLAATRPATDAETGKTSKSKAITDPVVAERSRARLSDLLARHPLYPEIDLDILDNG